MSVMLTSQSVLLEENTQLLFSRDAPSLENFQEEL
jgi:hypothetical protein